MTAVGVLSLVFIFLISYVVANLARGNGNEDQPQPETPTAPSELIIETPPDTLPGPIIGPSFPDAPDETSSDPETPPAGGDPGTDVDGAVSSTTDDSTKTENGNIPPAGSGVPGPIKTSPGEGQY